MANFGLIADDRPLNRALRWVRRGKAMDAAIVGAAAGFARSEARQPSIPRNAPWVNGGL
jgi:hypothetical protein